MTIETETALKIRCQRDDLLAAIQAADAVVPANSAKPILTNLQLEAGDGRLEVIATDLQVGLRSIIGRVEVERRGQAVVQARQLAQILKESRSGSVSMELARKEEQSQLQIQLADGDYQIPAVIGEQFPAVSFFPGDAPSASVPAARFEGVVPPTAVAARPARTTAALSGPF